MSKTMQYVWHHEEAYPNQESFCFSEGRTFTENYDQRTVWPGSQLEPHP